MIDTKFNLKYIIDNCGNSEKKRKNANLILIISRISASCNSLIFPAVGLPCLGTSGFGSTVWIK